MIPTADSWGPFAPTIEPGERIARLRCLTAIAHLSCGPRSIELVETFLRTLRAHGLTDEQAVAAYRAFSSFLLGQLLLEAAVRGAATAPAEEPVDEGGAPLPHEDGQLDLSGAPEVLRLRPLLSEDRSREEFEVSLETLLDRLDTGLSQ